LESANEFAEHIALGIEEGRVACAKVKDEPAGVSAPGDRVWLDRSNIATNCKGNLTDLGRILHLSLAKGNPK
jgi:hypothetical protein